MRIDRLKLLAFMLVALSSVSCSVVNTSVTTKSLYSSGDKLVQAPLVAELDVKSPSKVNQSQIVTKVMRKRLSEEQIKDLVISSALEESNGDVMIEPRFSLTHNKRGHLKRVAVSGYSANYNTFRQFEAKDTLYLNRYNPSTTIHSNYVPKLSTGLTSKLLPARKSSSKPKRENKFAQYNGFVISPICTNLYGTQLKSSFSGLGISLGYKFKDKFIAGFEYNYFILDYGYDVISYAPALFFQYNFLTTRLTPFVRAALGLQSLNQWIESANGDKTGVKFHYTAQAGALLNMGRHYLSVAGGLYPQYKYNYSSDNFSYEDYNVSLTFCYGVTLGKRNK